MSIENNTFPQSGDPDDAVRFAQLVGQDVLTDHVGSGLHLDPDFEANELTVSEGVFYTSSPSDEATSDGKTILDLGYVSQTKETTLSIPDSGTQYVVANANVDTTDSPSITIEDNDSDLPDASIVIGEISVDEEVITESSRGSEVENQLADHTSQDSGVHGVPEDDAVASQNDVDVVSTDLDAHTSANSGVHGVSEDDAVASQNDVDFVSADLDAHTSQDSGVHGVSEDDAVASQNDVDVVSTDLDAHTSADSGVHGVGDSEVASVADIIAERIWEEHEDDILTTIEEYSGIRVDSIIAEKQMVNPSYETEEDIPEESEGLFYIESDDSLIWRS